MCSNKILELGTSIFLVMLHLLAYLKATTINPYSSIRKALIWPILLYVDDIILITCFDTLRRSCISLLNLEFVVKGSEPLNLFLSIVITFPQKDYFFHKSMHAILSYKLFLTLVIMLECYHANHSSPRLTQNWRWVPAIVLCMRIHLSIAALPTIFDISILLDQTSHMQYNIFISSWITPWKPTRMLDQLYFVIHLRQMTIGFTSLSLIYYLVSLLYICQLRRVARHQMLYLWLLCIFCDYSFT